MLSPPSNAEAVSVITLNAPTNYTKIFTSSFKPIWLKSTQSEISEDGEPQTPQQIAKNADIFQEREGAGGMRVGRDFQAKIPQYIALEKDRQTTQENNDKALLVWSPTEILSQQEIEKYLETARDKYQYSGEQSLGLLFWHRYDVERALQDLGNFTPHPEEWTVEDKVLFEQAFQFHGKAFDRIRQMLPDKTMSNLIRYYYKCKKFKNKTSVMDRQAKKFSQDEDDVTDNHNNNSKPLGSGQNYLPSTKMSRLGNLSDAESDDKSRSTRRLCSNCGIPCTELTENMCNTCFVYWKRTGDHRPLTGPLRRGDRPKDRPRQVLASLKQRQYPPKGMFINHDDLNKLASSTPQAENVTLQGLEKRVTDEKFRVQIKKQEIEMLKRGLLKDGIAQFKPKESEINGKNNIISSKWSQDEVTLAVQGVRRYGRNFQKIANIIGTKTEAHLKSFYASSRKRYNLDDLLKEYDLENESDGEKAVEKKPIVLN